MAFMFLGILLLVLKVTEYGPVAEWGWVWVLLPFGLAAAWWAFADSTGLTQRRAIRKIDERKDKRRATQMEALGLNTTRRETRVRAARETARRGQSRDEREEVSPDTNETGRQRPKK